MDIHEFNAVAAAVASDFIETELPIQDFFPYAVLRQNMMYELPVAAEPTFDLLGEPLTQRTQKFMRTVGDEVAEGVEILALERLIEAAGSGTGEALFGGDIIMAQNLVTIGGLTEKQAKEQAEKFFAYANEQDESLSYADVLRQWALVCRADWLADLTVYIRSEALKYGIPLEAVQNVVMNSNFTKLGEDGKPIKNADGKFLKGPNFIPPENHISALMFEREELLEGAAEIVAEAEATRQVTMPLLEDSMAHIIIASGMSIDGGAEYGLEDEDSESASDPEAEDEQH